MTEDDQSSVTGDDLDATQQWAPTYGDDSHEGDPNQGDPSQGDPTQNPPNQNHPNQNHHDDETTDGLVTPSGELDESTQVWADLDSVQPAESKPRSTPGDGREVSPEVLAHRQRLGLIESHLPDVHANHVVAGRYRLEEELAHRNQTMTWRAFDTKLSRPVLVHVIADDDPRRDAVLEAARKAAIATDSRFLRVLDAVSADAEAGTYIVCEFAPGPSLEKMLKQGPLSVIEAAWVVRELADALTPMHASGLFHRMLNPDTVIITHTGSVKIVGFLIDAALAPDETPDLAWSEREEADVRALGQLLYAGLVTRWPTMDQTDRLWWGLKPAPYDTHGWLTPRQVRGGVSPALDNVCDQILHERPRLGGTPLRSTHQIDQALSRVLGTADASADLEHRVRHPLPSATLDDTRSMSGRGASSGDTPSDVDGDSEQTGTLVHDGDDLNGDDLGDDHRLVDDHDGVHGPDNPRRRPNPRRPWLRIVLALIALSIIVGLVAVAIGQAGRKGDEPEAVTTPTGPQKLPIAKVDDFDPKADGGNDEENPNQVSLAWDGKPATVWTTLTYRGNPKMGGLKPGVGLVIDLGQAQPVGAVKLRLQGDPTGVAIYVPQGQAAAVTKPDMSTIERWKQVANNGAAPEQITLRPASPVTTRFVLVYISQLPQADRGRYRAAIAEMEVTT